MYGFGREGKRGRSFAVPRLNTPGCAPVVPDPEDLDERYGADGHIHCEESAPQVVENGAIADEVRVRLHHKKAASVRHIYA